MGTPTSGGREEATVRATGAFNGTGSSPAFAVHGRFALVLSGTFVATVQVEASADAGTTWVPCTMLGSVVSFTVPCREVLDEPEPGMLYRLTCTAYTSGSVNWRVAQ